MLLNLWGIEFPFVITKKLSNENRNIKIYFLVWMFVSMRKQWLKVCWNRKLKQQIKMVTWESIAWWFCCVVCVFLPSTILLHGWISFCLYCVKLDVPLTMTRQLKMSPLFYVCKCLIIKNVYIPKVCILLELFWCDCLKLFLPISWHSVDCPWIDSCKCYSVITKTAYMLSLCACNYLSLFV